MKHYTIKISGRVQGVGFRYSARAIAMDNHISGFIRNEPDGSVYLEAEGKPEDLDNFLHWCYKGPGVGRIDKVVFFEAPLRDFDGFDIKHF